MRPIPVAHRSLRFTLALALCANLGCSMFGGSKYEPIVLPIPEEPEAIRSEIAVERSRLLDLMNANLEDDEQRDAHREIILTIAARLSQLEEALATHDAETP